MHWNLSQILLQNVAFFLVSRDTRKKPQVTNIWMEAFPWSSGLEKKIQDLGDLKINPPPFLFRGLKVTGRPPSRSENFFVSQKSVSFLIFDALIAILIFEGREVVFRKAQDELYHVVGSEKTRNRKTSRKKRKETVWCLFLCFRSNSETRVEPFHNQVRPVLPVLP